MPEYIKVSDSNKGHIIQITIERKDRSTWYSSICGLFGHKDYIKPIEKPTIICKTCQKLYDKSLGVK